jgi:FkbM family methyltransferase
MKLIQELARHAVLMYGVRVPYHRGKWRVIDSLLRKFQLDQAEAGNIVRADRDGIKFGFDLSRYLDRTIYFHGGFESYETEFVRSLIKPGAVVLDIGANIGWWTLHLHQWVGPQGWVFAFEPDGSERSRLKRNLDFNSASNVTLLDTAVSDSVGEIWLSPTFDGGTTHIVDDPSQASGRVPVTTVDAFIERESLSRLDFIKCDIEGAELRFLRGAESTLKRFRPIVMVELYEPNLRQFGTSRAELLDRLVSLGYSPHRVTAKGLQPLKDLPDEAQNVNIIGFPE